MKQKGITLKPGLKGGADAASVASGGATFATLHHYGGLEGGSHKSEARPAKILGAVKSQGAATNKAAGKREMKRKGGFEA